MKKSLLLFIAVIGLGICANAQSYVPLNIESDASRYNRELELLKKKQEIERIKQETERIRQGNMDNQGTQSNITVNPNANVLQKNSYSDEKVLVYIESKSNSYTSNCRGERKADRLIIENISGATITVKYAFRSELRDCEGYFEKDATIYREKTLYTGEKIYESGYLSNGRIGYYYVDSFSVIYTKY